MNYFKSAVAFLSVLVITPVAVAQEPRTEAPLAVRASDSTLTWSPCPPIFPAGCEITVLWGDPANGRSDILLRTSGDSLLPPHYHTSPEHMILVSGEMRVKYAGHEEAVLEAGSYAYGPPELAHDARCTSSSGCVLFISFESAIDAHAVDGGVR